MAIGGDTSGLNLDEDSSCATPKAKDTNMHEEGMSFDSKDIAFEFYNYKRLKGFGNRRQWVNRSSVTDMITSRKFSCSKEGFRCSSDAKNPRKETRTGCSAYMIINHQSNNRYAIVKFSDEHNRGLVTPSKTHLLRCQRKINFVQSVEVDLAAKSGLNPKETYDFMSRQAGGWESLGFIHKDLQNYLSTKRKYDMKLGEAESLLYYFQKKQDEDPSFQYSVQLDSYEQITNILWCDSNMRLDYERFGDVVSFDTTYRINRDCTPFTPFVGVNNHKETVVLGAVLLYDETKESFKWLFESFVQAMHGKNPKTILTDQDHAMRAAILSVLTEIKHCLCVWHLHQNARKHLSHVYKKSSSFAQEF